MERAKTERQLRRRSFTISANKVCELLKHPEINADAINIEFKLLTKLYEDLCTIQNKVLNYWLDDENRDEALLEKDMDTANEYISRCTENLRPLTPSMFLNINNTGNQIDFIEKVDGAILSSRWRLVLELMPGADGQHRVARLRTAAGERIRALQRIYRLEVSTNSVPQEVPKVTHTRSGRVVQIPQRFRLN
ncbi:hypothetical protein ACJJTC_013951 [Scirpophaga incertulas]